MKLINGNEQIIDSLTYDDMLPWPIEADGSGATLELIDAGTDNADGKNWKASNGHGTPGGIRYNGMPPVLRVAYICIKLGLVVLLQQKNYYC